MVNFFRKRAIKFFQGEPTTVKFHLTNSKLTENHFSTKISNFKIKTPLPPPSEAHEVDQIRIFLL